MPPKKKKRILFIEDEPDQIAMIRLRLEKEGYEVLAAQDGIEGLGTAIREVPDLILLDVVIPGMNGFEVCKQLKKETATRHIPVIATTAAGNDDIEQICLAMGASHCVRKPYESSDLLAKIQRLIKK